MKKELTQRQLQVGQEIKRIIADMISKDEIRNLQGIGNCLVTVTEARISPDLKYCNVYIITSVKEKEIEVLGALQLAAHFIRKQIGAKTHLKYIPTINFRIDNTFEEVDKIQKLLHNPKVKQDLEQNDD
ncbi:MAG: 30S ribosome-binding factor RbfA [Alphaproteobacteria bacterium]